MIVETSGWRHLKEENKLFLSYEYQKMYRPSQEMAQLPQIPQIENGKPDFSPTFQKVKLRNSSNYVIRLFSNNHSIGSSPLTFKSFISDEFVGVLLEHDVRFLQNRGHF